MCHFCGCFKMSLWEITQSTVQPGFQETFTSWMMEYGYLLSLGCAHTGKSIYTREWCLPAKSHLLLYSFSLFYQLGSCLLWALGSMLMAPGNNCLLSLFIAFCSRKTSGKMQRFCSSLSGCSHFLFWHALISVLWALGHGREMQEEFEGMQGVLRWF